MDRAHLLWAALAAVAVAGAVAVFLGIAAGDAGIAVESVDATGSAPVAEPACGEAAARAVTVSVKMTREPLSVHSPQPWGVGLTVRASALGETETRSLTVGPGASREVRLSFTQAVPDLPAARERADAVVQVSQGTTVLNDTTAAATLPPVTANESC